MAFIKVIDEQGATGPLRKLYDQLTGKDGIVDNILRIHSLNPRSLETHMALYRHLMFGRSGLSRRRREMIGVTVSVLNRCHY